MVPFSKCERSHWDENRVAISRRYYYYSNKSPWLASSSSPAAVSCPRRLSTGWRVENLEMVNVKFSANSLKRLSDSSLEQNSSLLDKEIGSSEPSVGLCLFHISNSELVSLSLVMLFSAGCKHLHRFFQTAQTNKAIGRTSKKSWISMVDFHGPRFLPTHSIHIKANFFSEGAQVESTKASCLHPKDPF